MQQVQPDEKFFFYMPPKLGEHFGSNAGYIWQKSLHKFYFRQREKIDIWHTTYQSSPYKPAKKGSRRILTIHDLNFLHEQKSKEKEKKYLAAVQQLDQLARVRFHRRVVHLAVRWMLDQGVSVALWGGRHPDQLQAALGVAGWSLDAATLQKIDHILDEAIPDPIGPEFMAPLQRSSSRNVEVMA